MARPDATSPAVRHRTPGALLSAQTPPGFRRGSATLWGVVFTGTLLGIAALTVDAALLYGSRGDLQAAADSAALAGASALTIDPAEVRSRATGYAAANHAAGEPVEIRHEDIVLGTWDYDAKSFTPLASSEEDEADAVRVTTRLATETGNPLALAFAGIFGTSEADVRAEATAVYRPRDIALVLDYSGSMSDDSEIQRIPTLGRSFIESNLRTMWEELGSPRYGNLTFETRYISSNDRNVVRATLGLDNVPYPYPAGSWNEFIDYVRTDGTLNTHGYRRQYGGLTLVNYWMARRGSYSNTPDLWMTSQQPLRAVKDAVSIFLDFLREEATEDRVALIIYNSASEDALLEISLTDDFDAIETTTFRRQAGHYNSMTNIGAGMRVGREHLVEYARPGAQQTMILLTDGVANRPGTTAEAQTYVRTQARLADEANIPIATISLGSGADASLMREVAERTGAVHFNIPGGQGVAAYEEDLRQVFRRIAIERPLRLVR